MHTPEEKKPRKQFYIYLLILIFFAYFPAFLELNDQSVRMWDESFYAINAYEMMNNGNLLVKYFNGSPDMYNLKPPLMTWIQALSMKIFGVGEFALRFPSALSGLLLMILLLWLIYKNIKIPLWGLIAGLIMATTPGYICNHVVRTGDYDATLTLFLFLSLWQFYLYLLGEKTIHYYWSTLFIILAVYTKGVAGLLFLPAMFVLSIAFKKFRQIITSREFYISLLALIVIVGAYYFFKEKSQPGYLNSWIKYESVGRFIQVQDGHSHSFFYYFGLLIKDQFVPWIIFLPLSLLLYFWEQNIQLKRILKFSFISFLAYIIIISIAQSKMEWYTAPMLPFLAIISAYSMYKIIGMLTEYVHLKKWIFIIGLSIGLISISFVLPYVKTIQDVTHPETKWAANKFGDYFKHLKVNYPDFTDFTVFHAGFNSQFSNISDRVTIYFV